MKRFGALIVALVLVLTALAIPRAILAASPSNDNFANATTLPIGSFTDRVSVLEATIEPADPVYCGSLGNTVWYTFTAGTDSYFLTADAIGSDYTPILNFYRTSPDGLQPYTCSDLTGTTVIVSPGETWYIQVTAALSTGTSTGGTTTTSSGTTGDTTSTSTGTTSGTSTGTTTTGGTTTGGTSTTTTSTGTTGDTTGTSTGTTSGTSTGTTGTTTTGTTTTGGTTTTTTSTTGTSAGTTTGTSTGGGTGASATTGSVSAAATTTASTGNLVFNSKIVKYVPIDIVVTAGQGSVDKTGYHVTLTGTVRCSRPVELSIYVPVLSQTFAGRLVATGSGGSDAFSCGPTATSWTAIVNGAPPVLFGPGQATAMIQTSACDEQGCGFVDMTAKAKLKRG